MSAQVETATGEAPRIVTPRTEAGMHRRALAGLLAAHVLTVAIIIAVGLPTIVIPFWSDTAIFALVGQAVADGAMPYVGAWDQKPPAVYLIYAAAIQGPFTLFTNVRVFDLLWTGATAALLLELGRRWWGLRAGIAAALTYGVVYFTSSGWWQLAQPDGLINLPLALALLLQSTARGCRAPLLAAGLALGIAFQLRAISVLLVPFIPYVSAMDAPRGRRQVTWLRELLWLGAGFALCQAVLTAYLARGGALGEYIAATRFAAGYTDLGGPWQGPHGPTLGAYLQALRLSLPTWALSRPLLTAPAATAALAGTLVVCDRRVQQLTIVAALAYAGIAIQGKFFWYHYWYMLGVLALLAGWGWHELAGLLRGRWGAPAASALTVALATLLVSSTPEVADSGWLQWQRYLTYHDGAAARERFDEVFYGYPASRRAADYVRERTEPNEPIYIWGYDPLIYLLADRPHASRFIYAFPMMSDWAPAAWQSEFMDEMRANRPVYFVAQRNHGGPWITGHSVDPVDYIAWFPELDRWLKAEYARETEFDDYVVYRRHIRPADSPPPAD